MRPVMLDEVHAARLLRNNSLRREQLAYLRDADTVDGTGSEAQPPVWPQRRPHQFVPQMSLGIARNRDIVWSYAFETCFCRTHRQPCPVLDAIQPLLLQRGHKISVPHQRR